MVETEREMLREEEEKRLGLRVPFDSSRQAEYEDSVPASDWESDGLAIHDNR